MLWTLVFVVGSRALAIRSPLFVVGSPALVDRRSPVLIVWTSVVWKLMACIWEPSVCSLEPSVCRSDKGVAGSIALLNA